MGPVRRLAAFPSLFGVALSLSTGQSCAQATAPSPLQLEAKIALGSVRGRIDHMAIDHSRGRLFVAELENSSVGVVDLTQRKLIHRITGLQQPQGVVYVPSNDAIYVANAADGTVQSFRGSDFSPIGQIDLGDDADNIRLDKAGNRIVVGYGEGALAILAVESGEVIANIRLKAHPESFQLDHNTGRIFVNVPKAYEIAIVDRTAGRQVASWPVSSESNFPMALDQENQRVLAVFRNPEHLAVYSMKNGSVVANVGTCGDADDVFHDEKRKRVYISCGTGFLDVLAIDGTSYNRIGKIPTSPGTRTSLYVPELDRMFVAVRVTANEPAAIWVYRPSP